MKDVTTKEVLAYCLSDNIRLEIALTTIERLMEEHGEAWQRELISIQIKACITLAQSSKKR